MIETTARFIDYCPDAIGIGPRQGDFSGESGAIIARLRTRH
jgi:hypothetical protein